MNHQHKEDLKGVAKDWAEGTLSDWLYEEGAWDHLTEVDLSNDDLDYIRENFKFTVTVGEK